MDQIFMFEHVAIVVGPWFEPGPPPERGARVEVRVRAEEPHRGSESAAQRFVIDQPLFRADLFDRLDGPVGNLAAAHFHEGFDGVEPRDRQWPAALARDALAWLRGELADLSALLARSAPDGAGSLVAVTDAAAICDALDAVEQAVVAVWQTVRAEPV
jgi:hypothetical protein